MLYDYLYDSIFQAGDNEDDTDEMWYVVDSTRGIAVLIYDLPVLDA